MKEGLKQKISVLTIISTLALLLFGCNGLELGKNNSDEETGLQIYSMSTGLGSISNDNLDQQRLTYNISITNESDTESYIQWIEPILGEGIRDKIITEELQITVEKSIPAKGSLEVEGVIVFDTLGLTKEEIINLEPFITGINVNGEKVIEINTQGRE
jgi:hypothetical protein